MGVKNAAEWLGDVLRAIPGPTDGWASIIDSVAWPLVLVYLVGRYRVFIKSYLQTIAERLRTDHVKFGMFELTPNSEVITLDPETVDESTEHYEPADIERIERLFEFISDSQGFRRFTRWMNEHVDEALEISEFLTDPDYATQREAAYQALFEEGK